MIAHVDAERVQRLGRDYAIAVGLRADYKRWCDAGKPELRSEGDGRFRDYLKVLAGSSNQDDQSKERLRRVSKMACSHVDEIRQRYGEKATVDLDVGDTKATFDTAVGNFGTFFARMNWTCYDNVDRACKDRSAAATHVRPLPRPVRTTPPTYLHPPRRPWYPIRPQPDRHHL